MSRLSHPSLSHTPNYTDSILLSEVAYLPSENRRHLYALVQRTAASAPYWMESINHKMSHGVSRPDLDGLSSFLLECCIPHRWLTVVVVATLHRLSCCHQGNTLPLARVWKATGKFSLICVAEIPITENPNLFSPFTNGKHSDENFLYLEIH
jgi:hypothetical protein